jgi:feruloyl esterase
MACRAIFDVTQGAKNRRPWAAKRCPNNVDPNPEDTSANACLTDGQISTLQFTYARYSFATPLAHGTRSFGMWVPNTDPSGSGLILNARFRGQEGAAEGAPMHAHLGVLGVTGFLMKNLSANPLDYAEGGSFNRRREELSAILDGTNPDLSAFQKRGGKMIVTIGTNDTLASPGAQLDYYQSVLDRMGRATVDGFARLFVMPQTGHGLSGTNYGVTARGARSRRPRSQSVRPARTALRLGRERQDASDVRHGDRRRQEPATVFVSGLSEIQDRSGWLREFVRVRDTTLRL